MLRNFAAALLAATLIAGPAFAVEPSGNASSPAPATAVRTDAKATVNAASPSVEPAKHLRKHVRSHTRKHVAHRSIHRTKTAHHFQGSKTHKVYVAPKTVGAKSAKAAGAQPIQVPATRTN
jgi:hypothetical protein